MPANGTVQTRPRDEAPRARTPQTLTSTERTPTMSTLLIDYAQVLAKLFLDTAKAELAHRADMPVSVF